MDRNTAIARIQRGLGFRTDLVEEIASAMQEQQRLLEMGKTFPKFLLQEDQTLNLLTGDPSIAFPERFLQVSEEDGLSYFDADGRRISIPRRPFAEAQATYETYEPQGPLAYSLRANSFYFWPVPDQDYTISLSFYQGAELLTTNIENAWLLHNPDVLIAAAGISIATDLRDASAVQLFTALYNAAMLNQVSKIAQDEVSDMPIALGRNT